MQIRESGQITMVMVAPMVIPFVVLKSQVTATSSEAWGGVSNEKGKYSVKIYTIDGVLIYQVENGTTNAGKTPKGGIIAQSSDALSMATTIANPITFYGSYVVINQSGHSGDLYNYYWTSYSRGTDGRVNTATWTNEPNWHNVYLDGYIPLRVKSIYDPCPYLYRIPSNGTYNQFKSNTGWTWWSYLAGAGWKMNTEVSWLLGLGLRNPGSSAFEYTGSFGFYRLGTVGNQNQGYLLEFTAGKEIRSNRHDIFRSQGTSVRCIEATLRNENHPTLFYYWWRNC